MAFQSLNRVLHSHDNSAAVQMKLHEYFKSHGYACPTDSSNGAFQWAFNTKETYFHHIHKDPETMKDFDTFMSGNRSPRQHWIDWFPVESEIISGSHEGKDEVLLVDAGGGKGHDLETFLEKFPGFKGRLVLQDLPGIIDNLKGLNEAIQAIGHDFFNPQPVKGRRSQA